MSDKVRFRINGEVVGEHQIHYSEKVQVEVLTYDGQWSLVVQFGTWNGIPRIEAIETVDNRKVNRVYGT